MNKKIDAKQITDEAFEDVLNEYNVEIMVGKYKNEYMK